MRNFLKSKEQKCGFVLFVASTIILFLFGFLHHKLDCYSCNASDFLPRRQTPFFYDVFFWLATIGVLMSLFGQKLRILFSWMKSDDVAKNPVSTLYFSSTKEAFKYAQKYTPKQIKEGQVILGIVEYVRAKNDIQIAVVELACGDDLIVKATGITTDEVQLKSSDLIYWIVADIESQKEEFVKRGAILATIKPEFNLKNGWVLSHKHKSKK